MQSISTIGLDIAKSVFQVHGVDATGQVSYASVEAPVRPGVFPEAAALPGGDRGLRIIGTRFAVLSDLMEARAREIDKAI